MKIYYNEFDHDYSRYRFGYSCRAVLEPKDNLKDVYAQGFLPASDDPSLSEPEFYLARSLRINLSNFQLNKKRRYIQQSGATEKLTSSLCPITNEYREHLQEAWPIIGNWLKDRHGRSFLSEERFNYILQYPTLSHCLTIFEEAQPVAYLLLCEMEGASHYWFALYNPQFANLPSPGQWCLGHFLEDAQKRGLDYAYLGTVYGQKAHYKFRGMTGPEFWDGRLWNPDRNELKRRISADEKA